MTMPKPEDDEEPGLEFPKTSNLQQEDDDLFGNFDEDPWGENQPKKTDKEKENDIEVIEDNAWDDEPQIDISDTDEPMDADLDIKEEIKKDPFENISEPDFDNFMDDSKPIKTSPHPVEKLEEPLKPKSSSPTLFPQQSNTEENKSKNSPVIVKPSGEEKLETLQPTQINEEKEEDLFLNIEDQNWGEPDIPDDLSIDNNLQEETEETPQPESIHDIDDLPNPEEIDNHQWAQAPEDHHDIAVKEDIQEEEVTSPPHEKIFCPPDDNINENSPEGKFQPEEAKNVIESEMLFPVEASIPVSQSLPEFLPLQPEITEKEEEKYANNQEEEEKKEPQPVEEVIPDIDEGWGDDQNNIDIDFDEDIQLDESPEENTHTEENEYCHEPEETKEMLAVHEINQKDEPVDNNQDSERKSEVDSDHGYPSVEITSNNQHDSVDITEEVKEQEIAQSLENPESNAWGDDTIDLPIDEPEIMPSLNEHQDSPQVEINEVAEDISQEKQPETDIIPTQESNKEQDVEECKVEKSETVEKQPKNPEVFGEEIEDVEEQQKKDLYEQMKEQEKENQSEVVAKQPDEPENELQVEQPNEEKLEESVDQIAEPPVSQSHQPPSEVINEPEEQELNDLPIDGDAWGPEDIDIIDDFNQPEDQHENLLKSESNKVSEDIKSPAEEIEKMEESEEIDQPDKIEEQKNQVEIIEEEHEKQKV